MKLPNRSEAYIPSAKLLGYLLSETHSAGKSKAKFFFRFGFTPNNSWLLEEGILVIAHTSEVLEVEETKHGTKYVLIGELVTPVGRTVNLCTVWVIEHDTDKPRFVTAYPN